MKFFDSPLFDFIHAAHWENVFDPWVLVPGSAVALLGALSAMTLFHWVCILLSLAVTISKLAREYVYWRSQWKIKKITRNNTRNKPDA